MARSIFVASFVTAALYAARVRHKHTEHQRLAVVPLPNLIPAQLFAGARSATMPRATTVPHWNANVQSADSPQISLRGETGRHVAPRMATKDRFFPDYPSNWKPKWGWNKKAAPDVEDANDVKTQIGLDPNDVAEAPDVWEEDWEDEQFWDLEESQWKTRDADGKWRDQKGKFTAAPYNGSNVSVQDELFQKSMASTAGSTSTKSLAGSTSMGPLKDYKINISSNLAVPGPVTKYNLNSNEAIESLKSDIPQALRFERDPQRFAPTNWDIYTDSFESEFKAVDQTSMRLLQTLIPSWGSQIRGLRKNKRALNELRTLIATLRSTRVLLNEDMTVSAQMGVSRSSTWVFEDVIETRWTANLVVKRFAIPKWLPPLPFESILGSSRTEPQKPESIVNIEAKSVFYLNLEGKIYRSAITELVFTVDGKPIGSAEFQRVLAVVAGLPKPRLPLPRDRFNSRQDQ